MCVCACVFVCVFFSEGILQFDIILSFSQTLLTMNRLFLRLSLPGELCKLSTVTPRESKPRGKVPGLPVMPSFGALKCAHVWPWMHNSSLRATNSMFPWQWVCPQDSGEPCRENPTGATWLGALHLSMVWMSPWELSSKRHKLLL